MTPFTYTRAHDPASAVAAVAGRPDAVFLAGGSNLVDHLKLGVATPGEVVDVTGLALTGIEDGSDGGLRIGAGVRNSDPAADARVRERYPVLARALLAGASPQIRHQASTAGNLLQRTRCVYFQDTTTPCNKREPGSGCSAIGGYERYAAILGASPACVATHPSDLAVALRVLDASVVVLGPDGERRLPFGELHRLPGDDPSRDTTLAHGELVTAVELPAPPPGARSTYVKVRDRASYAFALVSVAALLVPSDAGDPRDAAQVRLAFGGVAHVPWRATRAEEALTGVRLTDEAIDAAVELELEAATTSEGTAYKRAMLRGTVRAALRELSTGERTLR
ncbi:FAD binding domain-containing protein [Agilicoccus flavus]|uniref:FAD binding domain-containing protein n=1 Tax=Agilicoccus flavus TaxID=2775968 RepID=UPI001CF676FC|nr:xanthine dehydrogenase family protein subunit M [Agilicoccus flavus]